MEQKKTVGAVSAALLQQESPERSPIELERAMHEDYEKNFFACLETHKKVFNGDFYIVVLTKRERLMPNVLRNYFMARLSCPTPEWDQAVYRYHHRDERIEFLWVVPSKDSCEHLAAHRLEVAPEEQGLLYYVLQFLDGDLLRKAQQLNGELP